MELTYDLTQVDDVADSILKYVEHKIILFHGDLGAGKTTLIKSLVSKLGSEDTVSSPTFSIVNEYATTDNNVILHFDLYRLNSEEEAYDIGIEEYLERDCWKFIEWPERINIFNTFAVHSATIISVNENLRRLKFN
ncbi:tRNA (adenosine(37)-N6)-threonylcarbamoyltransferase complex ATPase subunit type 1 TsaE [Leeuwenhoekiella sp. LLG6367-2.1]|uniref:tRNA (adenosine(37)-N6)-threonylcarbamoyltransferase complex ATPase subunit type 1 TsaE n=1 Tax=Leeuwenhoekiella sp. LLG6367-2.1 TaxID=3160833 RepID=UPI003869FD88